MKVLFLHPFGRDCGGDWSHRLQRQAELMAEQCDLKIISRHTSPQNGIDDTFQKQIKDAIKNFKPDVLYVNGFVIAHYALEVFDKIVYDMGSFIGRKALIEQGKMNYLDMEKKSVRDLRKIAGYGHSHSFYIMEKEVIDKVKAIICWEGREANLVRKLYAPKDRLKEISMMVHETPESIPFEQKEDRTMTVVAKWGDKEKMGGIVRNIQRNIPIMTVGKGWGKVSFLEHSKLMDEMNKSKVIFCPFTCGGIGVVCEGLKLGCNVVAYDWYPFNAYLNDELIIGTEGGRIISRGINMIEKAMGKYYPPKKVLPTADEVVGKVLKVCEKVSKE